MEINGLMFSFHYSKSLEGKAILYSPSQHEKARLQVKQIPHWRRLREYRMQILHNLLTGKKVTSLGCGVFTKQLMQEMGISEESIGVEIDSYAIQQTKLKNPSCTIVKADVRYLPFKNQAFNCTVCSEVIEHMPTTKDAMLMANEIWRTSQTAVITTPNSTFGVKIRDPTHYQFFNWRKLREVLGENWQIYTTRKTLPKLFSYILPYESPKMTFLHGLFNKLDEIAEFTQLNKFIFFVFRGAFLIALTQH